MEIEEILGVILVCWLVFAFLTVILNVCKQNQRRPPRPRKPAPPPVRFRSDTRIYERAYDYRLIMGIRRRADNRWEEIEIYDYDHDENDWPRNGQRIRNMSQEELNGYYQSLLANGWEPHGEREEGPPLFACYRRPIDHPLKRR